MNLPLISYKPRSRVWVTVDERNDSATVHVLSTGPDHRVFGGETVVTFERTTTLRYIHDPRFLMHWVRGVLEMFEKQESDNWLKFDGKLYTEIQNGTNSVVQNPHPPA